MAVSTDNRRMEFQAEDYDPVNIDKWDGNAVKNALDDTIKTIMKREYDYTEKFFLVDIRLLICTLACGFSLFAVVWDYLYPFPESKYVLATCSITYFILMGVLTLFTTFKEKNVFTVGAKSGIAGLGPYSYLYASSTLPRYKHTYTLSLKYIDGENNTTNTASIKKSIAEWFDESGTLLIEKFYKDVDQLHNDVIHKKKK